MKIANSVALVTGANRGIGRALVEGLLARGARRIYAAGRDAQKLKPVVALDPARIVPLALDVTDDSQMAAAAAAAGDVTLLINNAGVANFGRLFEGNLEAFTADMEVNYFGVLKAVRAFTPVLQRNGGAIVNVLSMLSLASMPYLAGYSASKAAAYSLTQALRAELKPLAIDVHGVFPGPVDTDMIRDVPMPKTSPAEVARAVLAGVETGEEDIRPDPMSQQWYQAWRADTKALERQFGTA